MTLGVTVNGRHFSLFAPTGSSSDWHWLLGVAAFPSVIYTAMRLAIPESPRWLLGRKRDRAAGIEVLQLIWVKMMVPETKGRTLETIQQKLGLE